MTPRLHGSYEALKYGSSLDGLSDLTGGISESIPLKSESTGCSHLLANLLSMTSIVTCKVNKDADKDQANVSIQCYKSNIRLKHLQNIKMVKNFPDCAGFYK
jgi:hypothetical protein